MLAQQTSYVILPSNDSTLAIEVYRTGLMKRKHHLLFFERFRGEFSYNVEAPEAARITMEVDSASLVCRDKWLKPHRRQQVAHFAMQRLSGGEKPVITFASTRVTPKPIRGFTIEGLLRVQDISRSVNVNMVVNQTKPETLQMDGDATLRLSDFGMAGPSSLFGLIGTKDEALVWILLWARQSV